MGTSSAMVRACSLTASSSNGKKSWIPLVSRASLPVRPPAPLGSLALKTSTQANPCASLSLASGEGVCWWVSVMGVCAQGWGACREGRGAPDTIEFILFDNIFHQHGTQDLDVPDLRLDLR